MEEIFQGKNIKDFHFQFLKLEDFMLFFVMYDSELNIFGFWTVWTL